MRLSIIVGLYNMEREAPRTLTTLSPGYQGIPADDYEVVLVDNGSRRPLAESSPVAHSENVRYTFIDNADPSPTNEINAAVDASTGDLVMVVIDGARMLSPRVLQRTLQAFQVFDDPFVYAASLHLGSQLQNDSAHNGYDQSVEDELLATVDWRADGYELFGISNINSVPQRLARSTFESNCFTVHRETWDRVGGYHPGFAKSTGGGVANWELFVRFMDADLEPVLLVGEATFHQFHGGASTNHPRSNHPIRGWLREYQEIVGHPFAWPRYEPFLFGKMRPEVSRALYEDNVVTQVEMARLMSGAGDHHVAIAIAHRLVATWPGDPNKLELLAYVLDQGAVREEALDTIDQAIAIAPTQAELHVTRGIIMVGAGRLGDARAAYETAMDLDPLLPEAVFHLGHLELRLGNRREAVAAFKEAVRLEPNPPQHYLADLEHARA